MVITCWSCGYRGDDFEDVGYDPDLGVEYYKCPVCETLNVEGEE